MENDANSFSFLLIPYKKHLQMQINTIKLWFLILLISKSTIFQNFFSNHKHFCPTRRAVEHPSIFLGFWNCVERALGSLHLQVKHAKISKNHLKDASNTNKPTE